MGPDPRGTDPRQQGAQCGFQGPDQVEWNGLQRSQAAVTRGRDEEQ